MYSVSFPNVLMSCKFYLETKATAKGGLEVGVGSWLWLVSVRLPKSM